MAIFSGSGVALVTPFNRDFTINFEAFNRLVEYQIEHQTDAIIVCGTTGEASTLSDHEHRALIAHAVKVIKKECLSLLEQVATILPMVSCYHNTQNRLVPMPYSV